VVYALLIAALGVSAPASALDVDRSREGEAVVVTALLSHSLESVRALLSNDETTMRLGKDIRDVKVTPMSNGCVQLEVANVGLGKDLRYVSERCETKDGWHSKMVSSEDFLDHDIRWSMQSENDSTRVSIRVVVQLKSIVPRWLVDRFVGRALEQTLIKMDGMLADGRLAD